MSHNNDIRRIVESLLAEGSYSEDEEYQSIEKLQAAVPEAFVELIMAYARKKNRLEAVLRENQSIQRKMKQIIDDLTDIPWYSATVVMNEAGTEGKVLVAMGSSLIAVQCSDQVQPESLSPGQRVFISHEKNTIVDLDSSVPLCQELGVVEELHGDKLFVKARETELIPLRLAHTLHGSQVKVGDRVLFDRHLGFVYEVVPGRNTEMNILEEIDSGITLEMIGGIDAIKKEICDEIVMQLLYPEIIKRHQGRSAKGILLVSAPGNGKTMLAKALCNFVKELFDKDTVRFYSMPPGSHRHWLYGMSDQIIIKMFRDVKEFTKIKGNKAVIFMDEVDAFGKRSNDIGNSIDSRILGTLLAQIDGVNDNGNLLLIGAANRADELMDTALTRPGRFGDAVYRIPRPDRESTRAIFSKYLTEDLPYRSNGNSLPGHQACGLYIDAATARIFAPSSPLNQIATLVLRDGTRKPVRGCDLISGASIENMVRKAKSMACRRAIRGTEGILLEDLLASVDGEIRSAAQALKSPRNARDILSIGPDTDFRVELPDPGDCLETASYRWMRA